MIKIKLYILSVLLLLVSCTGNKVIDEQITRADSLMEANSDSALVALGMLDSLRKDNPKMSKAQQMRFDLIYAKGMNKGFVDFTTDSVMKQVVAYYDQHGSANERMPLNAKNAYRKNEKYSWIAKDTLEALIAAESQVNSSIMLESPSQIIEQCNDVYNNYKKSGWKANL